MTDHQPLRAPTLRPVTDERIYTGPWGCSLPRRAAELAPLMKVELVKVTRTERWLKTRERVRVRARGEPKHLSRYWSRLDEIASAVNADHETRRWWLSHAIRELWLQWRS